MRRIAALSFSILIFAGLVLTGCDTTGNGGANPDPGISLLQDAVQLTVPGGAQSSDTASVGVNYVKLDGEPSIEASGPLTVEPAGSGRTEPYRSQTYDVYYAGSVGDVIEETIVFSGSSGGTQVVDSLMVTISPGFISTAFSSSFFAIADYEDEQRSRMASGGTQITLENPPIDGVPDDTTNRPAGSNGVRFLQVDATSSGSVTFERRASVPEADRFTFLLKPNPTTDFNLSITFTEETGSGTATHSVELPISSADEWRKFTVRFDQLGDFNPVATRAGGNGPLTQVELSADADLTYHVDQLMLASGSTTLAEIEDFERTTGAYGPPFCPPSFSNTSMVDDESDGFTARSVDGKGCFGYNYGGGLGPPGLVYLDVEGSDVVSFRVNATAGDSLNVFVETPGGDGGFDNTGDTVPLPAGTWETVEVPIDSLGEDPSFLGTQGIRNFGFTAAGDSTETEILIDDIKVKAPSGN